MTNSEKHGILISEIKRKEVNVIDIKLLVTFIVLNAFNVIIQTVKSLCTVNGGKLVAASANAIAYGLYTVVVVYMVCELPLVWKVLIIGACNFIGVWFVKWAEEKARKDKLWKVEATVANDHTSQLRESLEGCGIPHNFLSDVGKWTIFNCYCSTKAESKQVKNLLDLHDAKYFVSETKYL